jgi:hypothetical protein
VNGRPGDLVNLYWSPLYPFLVGLMRLVTGGGARGEVAAMHATNFVCFAMMVAAFDYFIIQVFNISARTPGTVLRGRWGTAAAYGLFGAVALTMTPLELTTPDLLSSAAIFVALGALLRLHDADWPKRRREALLLGAALGIGTLAKAFLAPWAIVCLVVLAIDLRKRSPHELVMAIVACAVFLGPWTALLSARAGHLTTGEAGRLTYAWYVNEQDPPSARGTPIGARVPDMDAFLPGIAVMTDARGTDPMWFDPTRWNAGVRPHFSVKQQYETVARMAGVLVGSLSVLIYILFLLCVAPDGTRRRFWESSWVVIVPAIAGMGAYTLVLLTSRYIMAFIVSMVVMTLAGLPIARRVRPVNVLAGAVVSMFLLTSPANAFGFSFVVAVAAAMLVGSAIPTRRGVLWLVMVPLVLVFGMVLFSPRVPAIARMGAGVIAIALWAGSRGAIVRGRAVQFARGMHAAMALSIVLIIGGRFVLRLDRDSANAARADSMWASNPEWRITQDLRNNGIEAGTKIALIGPHAESYWARTARLQIVGNVPDPLVPFFWFIPEASRDTILKRFAAAGAQVAILTRAPPGGSPGSAWKPLRYSGWMLDLRR